MKNPKRVRISPRIKRAERAEMTALGQGKSHAAAERIERNALRAQPVTRSSGRGGRSSAR